MNDPCHPAESDVEGAESSAQVRCHFTTDSREPDDGKHCGVLLEFDRHLKPWQGIL